MEISDEQPLNGAKLEANKKEKKEPQKNANCYDMLKLGIEIGRL